MKLQCYYHLEKCKKVIKQATVELLMVHVMKTSQSLENIDTGTRRFVHNMFSHLVDYILDY